MNDTEFAAALKAIKQDTESRAAGYRAKIGQAKRSEERYQKRLDDLYVESETKIRDLSRSYLSIPAPADPAGTRTRRTPKWSLDVPVLQLIHMMPSGVVAVPDVWLRWNKEHPGAEVGRTTIRGVLERLRRDGYLEVIDDGKPGRTKVRQYRLTSIAVGESEEEGITAH